MRLCQGDVVGLHMVRYDLRLWLNCKFKKKLGIFWSKNAQIDRFDIIHRSLNKLNTPWLETVSTLWYHRIHPTHRSSTVMQSSDNIPVIQDHSQLGKAQVKWRLPCWSYQIRMTKNLAQGLWMISFASIKFLVHNKIYWPSLWWWLVVKELSSSVWTERGNDDDKHPNKVIAWILAPTAPCTDLFPVSPPSPPVLDIFLFLFHRLYTFCTTFSEFFPFFFLWTGGLGGCRVQRQGQQQHNRVKPWYLSTIQLEP